MKLLLCFTTILLVAGSCSKDVKNTNKIHGDYTIRSITGTHEVSDVDGIMTFNKCDIPKKGYRTFHENYSYAIGGDNFVKNSKGSYTFRDKGKTLVVRVPSESSERIYRLDKLDKNSAVITQVSGELTGMTFVLEEE